MLDTFSARTLEDHLNGCGTTAIRSEQPAERERVIKELLNVLTRHTRSNTEKRLTRHIARSVGTPHCGNVILPRCPRIYLRPIVIHVGSAG